MSLSLLLAAVLLSADSTTAAKAALALSQANVAQATPVIFKKPSCSCGCADGKLCKCVGLCPEGHLCSLKLPQAIKRSLDENRVLVVWKGISPGKDAKDMTGCIHIQVTAPTPCVVLYIPINDAHVIVTFSRKISAADVERAVEDAANKASEPEPVPAAKSFTVFPASNCRT